VVISMNGSFGYFSDEDNCRHLAEAARVLHPGGRYLIDQQNPEILRNLPRRREVSDPDSGAVVIEEFELDPEARRINARKELQLDGEKAEFAFSVRLYDPEELMELLTQRGLAPKTMLGDYDLSDYSPGSSRLIIVAEKTCTS
jgi:hypothetical protein